MRLDTVIEVLDLDAGAVIARARFDRHLRFVSTAANDPLLFSFREGALGALICDIWEARIARQ